MLVWHLDPVLTRVLFASHMVGKDSHLRERGEARLLCNTIIEISDLSELPHWALLHGAKQRSMHRPLRKLDVPSRISFAQEQVMPRQAALCIF